MKQKTPCPVAALARDARRLETECCNADEAGDRALSDKAERRLNATRAAISHLDPKSATGARYQLELIEVYADALIDGEQDTQYDRFHAIQRMTGAVSKFLAAELSSR
ncbi:MAG TPA: hypothetical protein VFA80_15125 [Xanthobacteraceae bacterium]|nr:hypothetical protein [Xanthobacteraceae bacterium]